MYSRLCIRGTNESTVCDSDKPLSAFRQVVAARHRRVAMRVQADILVNFMTGTVDSQNRVHYQLLGVW